MMHNKYCLMIKGDKKEMVNVRKRMLHRKLSEKVDVLYSAIICHPNFLNQFYAVHEEKIVKAFAELQVINHTILQYIQIGLK